MNDAVFENHLVQKITTWYSDLQARDQLALRVLIGFALLVLLIYGLVLPISEYKTQAEERYKASLENYQWMEANKAFISKSGVKKSSENSGQSLLGIANQTSKGFFLKFRRYQPVGDNGLSLWIDRASFNNVVLWLERLDQRYNISVQEIVVDRDEQDGLVNVRLVLQG